MKALLTALLLAVAAVAQAQIQPTPAALVPPKPYFHTLLREYKTPKMSASVLYTSKFVFDGGVTDVALIYHKADPTDTLWPDSLLKLGMPPLSWTLLEVGAGGNRETGFVHAGASINVAPTLLGPITGALKAAGGTAATIGTLLVAPNGSGLKISLGWKTDLIQDGQIVRLNALRFPPRFGLGYTYAFGE